jgi:hypothetical protein
MQQGSSKGREHVTVKTLYLHVGWRKTGSSAVQAFIGDKMYSGRVAGIRVIPAGLVTQSLVTGGAPLAHHGLAHFHKPEQWARLWDEACRFVAACGDERFLISSEAFSGQFAAHPDCIQQLEKRLVAFDRIIVICWMRRQDEYIASFSVQTGKHGSHGRVAGDRIPRFKDAYYHRVIAKLRRVIPRAEIRAYVYSRGSNVVRDFIHAVDVDQSFANGYQPRRVNTTVSPQMYRLQTTINRICAERGMPVGGLHALMLRAWDRLPEAAKTPAAMPLTLDERRLVLDRYRRSNERLCQMLEMDMSFFDPSEVELAAAPSYNLVQRLDPSFVAEVRRAFAGRPAGNKKMVRQLTSLLDEIGREETLLVA